MKLYVAGPMTGIPQFNYPRFSFAADALRACGYIVCGPHEMDNELVQHLAWKSETGDPTELPPNFDPLLENVVNVRDCEGVATLPDWQKSAGARHEVETAHRLAMPVAPVELWSQCEPAMAELFFLQQALWLEPEPEGVLQ